MLENEKALNEIDDEDLSEVAGGGLYNKSGFLKTTKGYTCQHYSCTICGRTDAHSHEGFPYDTITCRDCKWHKPLLCTNPLNKK